jgi:aminocarboxymuconate-semialdehyde decarboxylase
MRAMGVDAEVLLPLPGLPAYEFAAQDALRMCRAVNEFVARFAQADAKRFFGFGIVPLQNPELAAAELSGFKAMGLRGVEILSNVDGISLADARFEQFFMELQSLDLPVYVHAHSPSFGERLPRAAWGGHGIAAEIGITAAALAASGLFEKCPRLRLALSHGGGGYPLMLPRAQYFWGGSWNEEAPREGGRIGPYDLPHSPMEYGRKFFYDTLVFDRRAIHYLIDMLGVDRLLIGTDHPSMQREKPVGMTLRSIGLPLEVVERVTWHNGFTFLGVDEPEQ